MGLTETGGYIRRTYDDILNDKIQRAKELFGEDIETGDQTPLGKFIRINAYDQAIAEEEIEQVYYSRFPSTATGHNLDRLLPFAALTRNAAEAAVFNVEISGTAGHEIPVGFLVGTETELTFYTTEAAIIGEDGKCTVAAACTEAGIIGNVNASAINKAVNPDADITAVKGLECLSAGVDAESDKDLRARFKNAVAGAGSCNLNAIRSALLRVPTVLFAAVVENDTDAVDSEGRPPHSFQCYIRGGDGYEQEIAEAIFEKRPVGIQTHGDISVSITDASGNEKTVKYSTAENVMITARIQVKTNTLFPSDGAARVQANVSAYINGLGIGNSLVLSTIYGHVYTVPGVVEVTALELSTNGGSTYSAANVVIPQYGVAVCAGVNVEVA